MDTNDVVTLASQAAESVLSFRIVAFGARPSIDLKIFKLNLRVSIRTIAKEKEYGSDMPLSSVVDVVGKAAYSAAKKWNKVAAKNNLIDGDWFRSCVCDLAGGVVTKIGHQAHHQLTNDLLDLDEDYIDPQGPRDETANSHLSTKQMTHPIQIGSHSPSAGLSAGLDNGLMTYYGLGPAVHEALFADSNTNGTLPLRPQQHAEPLPLRHQLLEGWKAITKCATDPFSPTTTAECEATIASLPLVRTRKRAAPPSESFDESDDEDGAGDGGEGGESADDEEEDDVEDEEQAGSRGSSNTGSVIHRPAAKRARFDSADPSGQPDTGMPSSPDSESLPPSPTLAVSSRPDMGLGGPDSNDVLDNASADETAPPSYVAPSTRLSPRAVDVGAPTGRRAKSTSPAVAGQAGAPSARVAGPKAFWTRQEVDILARAKRENKTWEDIHVLLKKRHTSQACAKKHYNLQALRKTPASGETSDEAQKMPRV